jgi:hypothetical protein
MANELQINSVDDIMRVADIAMKSSIFAFKNPEEAAIKIMYGLEMGLPAFSALTGVVLIQGKATMSSNLVASLIKRSGRYNYTIPIWDEEQCTIVFTENGKNVGESTFTIEDAKRAQLLRGGGNWDKYPRAMLFARAITQGARAYCPDVFAGPIYDPEELTPDAHHAPPVVSEPVVRVSAVTKAPEAAPAKPAAKQHILAEILAASFGGDKVAKENFIIKMYDQLTHRGAAGGSAPDGRAMYIEIAGLINSGKITELDVRMMLQFDAIPVLKEDEVDDAGTGSIL